MITKPKQFKSFLMFKTATLQNISYKFVSCVCLVFCTRSCANYLFHYRCFLKKAAENFIGKTDTYGQIIFSSFDHLHNSELPTGFRIRFWEPSQCHNQSSEELFEMTGGKKTSNSSQKSTGGAHLLKLVTLSLNMKCKNRWLRKSEKMLTELYIISKPFSAVCRILNTNVWNFRAVLTLKNFFPNVGY